MNVSTIKVLCWLVSLTSLSLGVWYGYDFTQTRDERSEVFDIEHARSVLKDSSGEPELQQKNSIDYNKQVAPSWIRSNWTGKAPPEKPKVVEPEENIVKRHTPVEALLKVQMIRVDLGDRAASVAFVKYLPSGGFGQVQDGVLQEGDALPEPHPEVKVVSIEAEGVVFEYEGFPDVEPDTLEPPSLTDGNLIVHVDEDGVVEPVKRVIPTGKPRTEQFEKTTLVGLDRYAIGTEDAQHFNENYSQILTRDVSHRTHYDANGRRAGIEITRVRAGSIAARHGVQEGDIVISVNDHPVSSTNEAISFAKQNKDKFSVWTVVIERMGAQKTLTYESQQND